LSPPLVSAVGTDPNTLDIKELPEAGSVEADDEVGPDDWPSVRPEIMSKCTSYYTWLIVYSFDGCLNEFLAC